MGENVNLSDINYLKNIFIDINKIIYKCSPLIQPLQILKHQSLL
jgi:hypothetical protein